MSDRSFFPPVPDVIRELAEVVGIARAAWTLVSVGVYLVHAAKSLRPKTTEKKNSTLLYSQTGRLNPGVAL